MGVDDSSHHSFKEAITPHPTPRAIDLQSSRCNIEQQVLAGELQG